MKCVLLTFQANSGRNAFSLTEIVIALAVTTFCLAIILALLPVGTNTALSSRRETRSAYVADEIIRDLRASPFTNAFFLCQTNGGLAPLPSFSLAKASTSYLACDGSNNVLYVTTSSKYATGVTDPNANYLVQVTVTPTVLPNLSSVNLEVGAPAQASIGSRTRYGFQTMIGNRQ